MNGAIMKSYQDINSETVDRWVSEGWEWGKPISHEQYTEAENEKWEIYLTPTKPVPKEWLGEISGKKILGLACGGAQQMPILTAAGAECTVLDYSAKQLESEELVANREGYKITVVRADMTKPLPFDDESFDIIINPVSNCYVSEIEPIFRECFRVLKTGGRFLCGFDNNINFLVDDDEERIVNSFPFNPLVNPEQRKQLEDADCGMQFTHPLSEQIGGQLKAGFTLCDIYDDTNSEGRLVKLGIHTFEATLSVKK